MFTRSDPFFQLHDIITSGGKLEKKNNYISEYAKQLKETTCEREICPECKSDGSVVFNGECNTCTICGFIIEMKIDQGQEWRYYGASDSKSSDPTRVGGPTNNKFQNNLGTFMGPSRKNSQFYNYLRNLNNKWVNSNHKDITLNKIFTHMTSFGKRMGLKKNTIELAQQYYTEINKIHISRAGNRLALEAACLLEACRARGNPRTIKEFADAYNLDKKLMTKGHKRFREYMKQLENKEIVFNTEYIEPVSPKDYIPRYCSDIGVSQEIAERCKYAAEMAETHNIAPNNTPASIAVGSIYLISMIYNLGITKDQIKKATKGISTVTISKCFSTLFDNKDILIIDEKELAERIKINKSHSQ
jgi:transcription initiation factor TFIIB